jgi:UDP-glucose 4-epimerase
MQRSNKAKNKVVNKWLITGGRGFIGTNLRIALKEKYPEDEIVIVDNLLYDTGYKEGKLYEIDVRNWAMVADVFNTERPDYVIHLAGNTEVRESVKNPVNCFEENILGTLNCFELSKDYKVKKVIFASSCGVFGDQGKVVNENMDFMPQSPYATSKACCEMIAENYLKLKTKLVVLRFSNVYGPWSIHKNSLIAKFIKHHLDGKAFTIFGDGDQTRNFIYAKDAVRAIIRATKSRNKGAFCIASPRSYSINDFVEIFNSKYKRGIKCRKGKVRNEEIRKIDVNTKKARMELRFHCDYSFLDGIDETFQWYKENYNAD